MYLGIETSSAVSSVALMTEDKLVGELTIQAGLTHSEQLVPHIELLMKQCSVTKDAIQGIAVSIGPGSFTGLRIGLGTAKALAYAWQVPLLGIMTMEVLAHNFWQANGLLAVMIDAQKKNVYEGLYRWQEEHLQCIQEPTVKVRTEALAELAKRNEMVTLVGDGITKVASTISEYGSQLLLGPLSLRIPRASSLLLAALPRFLEGAPDEANTIAPYYIRRSEAEVVWDAKHPELAAQMKGQEPTVVVTEAAPTLHDEVDYA